VTWAYHIAYVNPKGMDPRHERRLTRLCIITHVDSNCQITVVCVVVTLQMITSLNIYMMSSGRKNLGTEGIAEYHIYIPISAYSYTNRS